MAFDKYGAAKKQGKNRVELTKQGVLYRDGFASDWLISQAVRSQECIFPRIRKRPHSRGLSWGAPVSGQKFLAFRSFGRGFWALVSARFFPISVFGEGRLVRLFPETGSRNARKRARRRCGVYNLGRLFCQMPNSRREILIGCPSTIFALPYPHVRGQAGE
jgi:hypothetical protein